MADRDEVIKGLECLARKQEPSANPCKGCGYNDRLNFAFCVVDVASDALELLKEQEAVVRCKDCKNCEYPKSEKEWCKKGHLHGNAETWFCADGERR